MKSVNQQVAHLINKHIAIQKCLKHGIVNIRSLGRFLIDAYSLPISLDAVISAIRRYDVEDISLISSKEEQKLFAKMAISTKDNVARIVLKDRAFQEISADFLGSKILKGNSRIIKAKETVTILVNQKDLEKKLALFKPGDIVSVQEDLAEIRLQFGKDISGMKGVVARTAGELVLRDINIKEVIFSIPDLLLYVGEDSLVDAHKALQEIKK